MAICGQLLLVSASPPPPFLVAAVPRSAATVRAFGQAL
jgi:hypothetical protein